MQTSRMAGRRSPTNSQFSHRAHPARLRGCANHRPPSSVPGKTPPMPGSRRHHRAASSFSSLPILYHRRLSSSSVVSRRRGAAEWTLRHRVGLASAVIRGGFFRMLSPRAGGRCRSVHRAESVDIVWGGRSRGMGRDDFVRGGAMEGRHVVDEVGWRRPCVT